jgi:L-fucose mutarotase
MMLKGIDPLLGPELLCALRAMGHGDEIAIVDANYPAQAHARRCLRADGHSATTMLEAILTVFPLDRMVEAAAFRPVPPDRPAHAIHNEFDEIVAVYEPGLPVAPLMGESFYDRVKSAYLILATGERRLYGNIVLRKGVIETDVDACAGAAKKGRQSRQIERLAQ